MSSDADVSALDVRAYTVPTDAPEADGTLTWDSTTVVVVRAAAAGVVGTGWTYGPAACADVVEDQLTPVVVGADAFDPPAISGAMIRAVRNAGRQGVAGMAVSAVDTAMWDLKARLLDLPLHRLLGAVRAEVPVYGSGGFTTYDDRRLAEQLEGWLSQGIDRVKIKIGESWGTRITRDVQRMRHARSVVGEETELFVDANGGYSAKQAIRLCGEVADLEVTWLEEPVSSDDLAGLRLVRDRVAPDVTAGEYGYDLPYFTTMCAAGAVDCLQVDLTRCGGLTEWVRVAAVAAGYGLEVSAHCAPSLSLPACAATPNFRHIEWFHDHVRADAMLFDGVAEVRAGAAVLPDAPGHGLALKEHEAEALRVA